MTINEELLKILVCPETKQPVHMMAEAQVSSLNRAIETGTLNNRAGNLVSETIDGALVREDQAVCYPIRDDIPIMLVDEAIPLPVPGSRDRA